MVNALALKAFLCICACSSMPTPIFQQGLSATHRNLETRCAVMSVRMALAKLCACTAGGAILGGGAVHVAENPPQRPALVHHSKVAAPRVAVRTVKRVRRVVRPACVVRQPGRTVVTRTFAYPPAP